MKDASRSVPVVAALLSDEQRPALLADLQADYDSLRERHAARTDAKAIAADRDGARRTARRSTGPATGRRGRA